MAECFVSNVKHGNVIKKRAREKYVDGEESRDQ